MTDPRTLYFRGVHHTWFQNIGGTFWFVRGPTSLTCERRRTGTFVFKFQGASSVRGHYKYRISYKCGSQANFILPFYEAGQVYNRLLTRLIISLTLV